MHQLLHYLGEDVVLADGATLAEYIEQRMRQPDFANARSIRNALDRGSLRQAGRLFNDANRGACAPDRSQLMRICAADIRARRVFRGGIAGTTQTKDQPGNH